MVYTFPEPSTAIALPLSSLVPPIDLHAGDTLLIASDGVTDNLRMGELAELVRGGTLERAGRTVVEACRSRMEHPDAGWETPSKPDDLTCLIYRCSSED